MRNLATMLIVLFGATQIFAQDRLTSLEGESTAPNGDVSRVLLVFDREAGLLHRCLISKSEDSSSKIGQYTLKKDRLLVRWWGNNGTEEAAIRSLGDDEIEYRILTVTSDVKKMGSVYKTRMTKLPDALAKSAIRSGDIYLERKRTELANAAFVNQQIMRLQHEHNMNLLRQSIEFCRALGMVTID